MSQIDYQRADIQTLNVPQVTGRGTGSQSVDPDIGNQVYDKTTKVLYVGDGSDFIPCMGASGSMHNPVTLAGLAGNVPNVAGATLVGQQLQLQYGNSANPGLVSHINQDFGGIKTFVTGLKITNMVLATQPQYNDPTNGIFMARQTQNGDLGALAISGDPSFSTQTTISWSLQKLGRQVFLGWSASTALAITGSSSVISTADGVVPVEFRPATTRYGTCMVYNGTNFVMGFVIVTTSGKIQWGLSVASPSSLNPFVTATAGTADSNFVYVN